VIAIVPAVRLDHLGHLDEIRSALRRRFPEQRGRSFASSAVAGEATAFPMSHFELSERRGPRGRIALLHADLLSSRAERLDVGYAVTRAESDESSERRVGNGFGTTTRNHAGAWNAASARGRN